MNFSYAQFGGMLCMPDAMLASVSSFENTPFPMISRDHGNSWIYAGQGGCSNDGEAVAYVGRERRKKNGKRKYSQREYLRFPFFFLLSLPTYAK